MTTWQITKNYLFLLLITFLPTFVACMIIAQLSIKYSLLVSGASLCAQQFGWYIMTKFRK